MVRFLKWVRPYLTKDEKDGIPPRLIPHSRHASMSLTPSSSSECLSISKSGSPSFFESLPFEIRRKILLEAFGEEVVHMELLSPDALAKLDEIRTKKGTVHGGHAASKAIYRNSRWPRRVSKDAQWQWWSSVCHRSPPILMGKDHSDEPWNDECLQGRSHMCSDWPGEDSTKCFIGAMGWLLSCRQAFVLTSLTLRKCDWLTYYQFSYKEGIDVLYSTNTVYLRTDVTIRYLRQLILPQRLASITSIEVLCYLHDPSDSRPAPEGYSDFIDFHSLINLLPKAFPCLKRLHLSVQGYIWATHWDRTNQIAIASSMDLYVLKPLERVLQQMGIQSCKIFLPTSLYGAILYRETGQVLEPPALRPADYEPRCRWRDLSGHESGSGQATTPMKGYWIVLGKRDRSAYNVVCMGF